MGLPAEILAALFAGFGVLLLATGIAYWQDRSSLSARIGSFVTPPAGQNTAVLRAMDRSNQAQSKWSKFPGWTGLGIAEERLVQAGMSVSVPKFLSLQVLACAVAWLLGFVFSLRAGASGLWVFLILIISVGLGVRVPRWIVTFMRARRLSKFEKQFPNVIDTISNALEAGLSLPQSLESIAREMPPPSGVEFSRVVLELSMGRSLIDALRGLLERVPLVDVDIFVTAIEIQYKIGGNLTDILRTIAHTVRERLRIRAEVNVLTAQQRASSWIVTGAPIAIAVVIFFVNPEYMGRLFDPGIGRVLLGYAVISVGIGFYVLQRIADIEV
jgi:tight adherence protein B